MKRHWLYYISPFVLAALFLAYAIIYFGLEPITDKHDGEDWLYLLFVVFLPAIFILFVLDYLIKSSTKGKVLNIWIIEAVVVTILAIWLKYLLY